MTSGKWFLAALLVIAMVFSTTSFGKEKEPTFTTIDVPGSATTRAFGINDRGDIVGSYIIGFGASHGFLLHKGEFTTIDVTGPFISGTQAAGINDHGDIVGFYTRAGLKLGFLLEDGNLTTVEVPRGASNTYALGINNRGDIVGADGSDLIGFGIRVFLADSGFLQHRGDLSTVEVPGALFTHALGINDHGDIVGHYFPRNSAGQFQLHGFVLDRGTFTTIDVPGASDTEANGINKHGDIVGSYLVAGVAHGFVLDHGNLTTIDIPGASRTEVFGINDRGDIVGSYTTAGIPHGFVLGLGKQKNKD
jgi:uncharacterized membrane protein